MGHHPKKKKKDGTMIDQEINGVKSKSSYGTHKICIQIWKENTLQQNIHMNLERQPKNKLKKTQIQNSEMGLKKKMKRVEREEGRVPL